MWSWSRRNLFIQLEDAPFIQIIFEQVEKQIGTWPRPIPNLTLRRRNEICVCFEMERFYDWDTIRIQQLSTVEYNVRRNWKKWLFHYGRMDENRGKLVKIIFTLAFTEWITIRWRNNDGPRGYYGRKKLWSMVETHCLEERNIIVLVRRVSCWRLWTVVHSVEEVIWTM